MVLCFWIGLYPKPFFDRLEKPVNYIVSRSSTPTTPRALAALDDADAEAEVTTDCTVTSGTGRGVVTRC